MELYRDVRTEVLKEFREEEARKAARGDAAAKSGKENQPANPSPRRPGIVTSTAKQKVAAAYATCT